jgi:hypothetical protein
LTGRWQAMLNHPLLQLELRRIHRKRWWPGRRFFMFYPALLGAALGYGVMLAVVDSQQTKTGIIATGVPGLCLLTAVTSLLAFGLPWIAPAFTAMTIAREREMGTLDLLRVTLMTERAIVLGKLGGCLAWLWPGILTLALLTPLRLVWTAGGGLFDTSFLALSMTELASDVEGMWVWLVLTGLVGLLKPWGDLALHASVGLFASTLCRSSGVAITASYGAILVARVALWLVSALVGPLLMLNAGDTLDSSAVMPVMMMASLPPLAVVLIEIVGAVLLVQAAIWWLKRV